MLIAVHIFYFQYTPCSLQAVDFMSGSTSCAAPNPCWRQLGWERGVASRCWGLSAACPPWCSHPRAHSSPSAGDTWRGGQVSRCCTPVPVRWPCRTALGWYRYGLAGECCYGGPGCWATCQVAVCGPGCSKPWTQPVTTCHWLWRDLLGVDQGLGHTCGFSPLFSLFWVEGSWTKWM